MEGVGEVDLPGGAQQPGEAVVAALEPAGDRQPLVARVAEAALQVDVHAVPAEDRGGPGRLQLAVQQFHGQPDRVAADIVEGPAGQASAQPDVVRLVQDEVEVGLDLAQVPDGTV